MKMIGNCYDSQFDCPFRRGPSFHSGYTGKSGEKTWYRCIYHKDYQRNLKKCKLAGDPKKQKEAWGIYTNKE